MSLEDRFPNLGKVAYKQTSDPDNQYNCIAWAVGQKDAWWEPIKPYYWPLPHPMWATVDNLKAAFAAVGFEDCGMDASLEPGICKAAIFADQGEYMHAARQLDNGWWASKLGPDEDIEHETLEGLAGQEYGIVVCVMKRPTKEVMREQTA